MTLRHLLGPAHVFGHLAAGGIQTPDAYLQVQARLCAPRAAPHDAPEDTRLVVYVNEDRLLVDCACGNGVVVSAEWEMACCTWCGTIYRGAQLVLPEDLEALDRLLGRRVTANRNFHPERETLLDIAEKNAARGLV